MRVGRGDGLGCWSTWRRRPDPRAVAWERGSSEYRTIRRGKAWWCSQRSRYAREVRNASLRDKPKALKVDLLICLTSHPVAGKDEGAEFWNHMASALDSNDAVWILSAAMLPELADDAGVSFAKAALYSVLSLSLISD